jgi:polar amino acid transport system substrate-binding protein
MPVSDLGRRATAAAALVAVLTAAGLAGRSLASSTPAIYTAAQAGTGAKLSSANCASCHGDQLQGNVGPALTGPNLVTLAKNTKLKVGDLFGFMALQMPLNAPASLKKDQYAAIMAYILKFNGYPAGQKALTYAAAMSSTVSMTSLKK